MSVRFNEESKTMEAAVRDIAQADGQYRLGLDRTDFWFADGSEVHAQVLGARCLARAGYRKEMPIESTLTIDGWSVTITGRMDGCYETEPGIWVVEEFKSTVLESPSARRSQHEFQALLYAYLWERNEPVKVRPSLVYVTVPGGREQAFELLFEPAAVEKLIVARVRSLLGARQQELETRQQKRALANRLAFPFDEIRSGQDRFMASISESISQRRHLVAQAATGTGKTAAALFPAVREGLKSGRQIWFLTSKTMQQQMAIETLRRLNGHQGFHSIQLRAKEKMCANDRVICHEDFCPYARDFSAKLTRSRLMEHFPKEQSQWTPDKIFAAAKKEMVCPFAVQWHLMEKADVVVGDYNYFFDPIAALHRELEAGEEPPILLIDEAHNLVDRARSIFSPELAEADFLAVRDHFLFEPKSPLTTRLIQAAQEGIDFLHSLAATLTGDSREVVFESVGLRKLWNSFEKAVMEYCVWKRNENHASENDPVMGLFFHLQRFVLMSEKPSKSFTAYMEKDSLGWRLVWLCLDPAPMLATIFRQIPAIFISATIPKPELFARLAGVAGDDTDQIAIPSPFPKSNRRVLFAPSVQTRYAVRRQNYPRIATLITEMAKRVPGHILVLFPSYEFLQQVGSCMRSSTPLLVQRPNLAEADARGLLDQLRNRRKPALLFAVLGGMYAEGLDYPGNLLAGVFVVSPGLPQMSTERELVRQYFDQQGESGFENAYLQPGLTKVIQAAGRLIRSEKDRGVIVLICARFLQSPYREWLPPDWFEESDDEWLPDPVHAVGEFFERSEAQSLLFE